jgi:hypothetical protein
VKSACQRLEAMLAEETRRGDTGTNVIGSHMDVVTTGELRVVLALALETLDNTGPGTPLARLECLLEELEKRFPGVVNPLSSELPEPLLLAALDKAIFKSNLRQRTSPPPIQSVGGDLVGMVRTFSAEEYSTKADEVIKHAAETGEAQVVDENGKVLVSIHIPTHDLPTLDDEHELTPAEWEKRSAPPALAQCAWCGEFVPITTLRKMPAAMSTPRCKDAVPCHARRRVRLGLSEEES